MPVYLFASAYPFLVKHFPHLRRTRLLHVYSEFLPGERWVIDAVCMMSGLSPTYCSLERCVLFHCAQPPDLSAASRPLSPDTLSDWRSPLRLMSSFLSLYRQSTLIVRLTLSDRRYGRTQLFYGMQASPHSALFHSASGWSWSTMGCRGCNRTSLAKRRSVAGRRMEAW